MPLSPEIQVHCGEETYRLSRLDQNLQNQYGLWCERDAWQVLQHTRQYCSLEDYKILLIDHQRMKREGEFELGGKSAATTRLSTLDGTVAILRLAMAQFRNVDADQVKRLYAEYRIEFDLALAEMFGQKKTGGTAASDGSC